MMNEVPVEELIKERVRAKEELFEAKRKYEDKKQRYDQIKSRLFKAMNFR